MKLLSVNVPMKNRFSEIEIIRGIAVLLVIINHCGIPFSGFLMAFHMPLFFIISGYLKFKLKEKSNNIHCLEYFKKRFIRLIIPYFCFELFCLLILIIKQILTHESITVFKPILNIILCYNNSNYYGIIGRLWFLPCIFFADCFVHLILKSKKQILLWFSTAIMLLVSMVLDAFEIILPFCLSQAFLGTFFILLGYLLGPFANKLLGSWKFAGIFAPIFMIFLVISCWNGSNISMDACKYGNWIYVIAGSFGGSYLVFIISKCLSLLKENNLIIQYLKYISFNSLQIFAIHLIIIFFIKQTVIGRYSAILLILVLFLIIPTINFVNCYCPIFGQTRRNK